MKTDSPEPNQPKNGVRYWRGPEELADTPELQEWMAGEFPQGAELLNNGFDRRSFVKLMSASLMLAGAGVFGVGCRRPEEEILPFATQPEGYVHGVPQYYATAMPTRTGAIPLVARSNDGRPTKVEGNARHPFSNGGTDIFAQSSVLDLYDPDRARFVSSQGNKASRNDALAFLDQSSRKFTENQGEGLCFLTDRINTPSRQGLQSQLKQKFPNAGWFSYEPVDFDIHQQAASIAFGRPVVPHYRLDRAQVILSFDCDFLGTEAGMEIYNRDFAAGRRVSGPDDTMSRLYVVEGLMSLTGGNADHRLRIADSQILRIAAQIASKVLAQTEVAGSEPAISALIRLGQGLEERHAQWVEQCAADLVAHRGGVVVAAGYRQPQEVHLIAHLINTALNALGNTVDLYPAPDSSGTGTIQELAERLNGGGVDTLVVLGGNPVYNAPASLNWEATQRKASSVVHLSYHLDETGSVADWHFPQAHYLESWGDARTADGTYVPVQPLIQPLFGGMTDLELLARLGGLPVFQPYEIVRQTYRETAGASAGENGWRKLLHDGFLAGSARQSVSPDLDFPGVSEVLRGVRVDDAPSTDSLEVLLVRDARMDDGRYNNNGWLQELPDPMTKVTWENVIAMSEQTARDLGVYRDLVVRAQTFTPLVRLAVNGTEVVGPLWIQPGLVDNTVVVQLGYGRGKSGRIGTGSGYNAYPLRQNADQWRLSGGSIAKEQDQYLIACTQSHWKMEGRPIIREANFDSYQRHPDFAHAMDAHEPPGGNQPLYENPLDELKQQRGVVHQWGMAIDLNACTGCSACVIACQSENNIPIVGKDQVSRSREMHWIRIDRYYSGDDQAEPQMTSQPMLCQHCEAAPCESVCPVNATVHDEEGLNVMAYNRCVGTRYCSNNCPYKVRRYNFFDYHKRPLKDLVGPVYSSPIFSSTDGEWDLARWWKNPATSHKRPSDEWELLKLVKNPDVSVRMRGVMEKCTFCLQRIEQAKIHQKVEARDSGDVAVPDGELKTACQQACPAQAISFGNLMDDQSQVSQWKGNSRNYSVLDILFTRPRLTYLAKVRNQNPAMPDYVEYPLSTQEYIHTNHVHGNPYEVHHAGDHGGHGESAEHGATHEEGDNH